MMIGLQTWTLEAGERGRLKREEKIVFFVILNGACGMKYLRRFGVALRCSFLLYVFFYKGCRCAAAFFLW